METLEYEIKLFEKGSLEEAHKTLIEGLRSVKGITIKTGKDKVGFSLEKSAETEETYLSYENTGMEASLKLRKPQEGNPFIAVSCNPSDRATIKLLRQIGNPLDLRIYSNQIDSYLPKDPGFVDYVPTFFKPKFGAIFQTKGFRPLFYLDGTLLFYAASKEDGTIHILNPFLLEYFLRFGQEEKDISEFNYQVANDAKEFVLKMDFGLAPEHFYKYYKKPLKIINHSGFDIYNIKRKVFVKPCIFELRYGGQLSYARKEWDHRLFFMDKIRERETLDDTLKRVLRDELEIADDYVGAVVQREVEFDTDRKGWLVPRLLVNVFVDNFKDRAYAEERASRGWMTSKESEKITSRA